MVHPTSATAAYLELVGSDWLNIGGTEKKAGWKILNVQWANHVDYTADVRNMSRLADQSFDVVYASHTLEHLGYYRDLPKAIAEIRRIIRPGGKLLVSVPNLDTLCRLFLREQTTTHDRFLIMRMMFGGQIDDFDYHFVGLNAELLTKYLLGAGFRETFQVPEFNLFDDTSSLQFEDVLISLNMVATV